MELLKRLRLPFTSGASVLDDTKALFREKLVDASFNHPWTPEAPLLDDPETRRAMYKIWWAYFDNTVYNSVEDGGYRDAINTWLGSAKVGNLAPLFNPVERTVRAYEYVFDGNFGEDIVIDELVKPNGAKVNPKIIEPLEHIWKWSNINGWKNELLIKTATLGSCGLRIIYSTDPRDGQKIFFVPEHPSIIRLIERDARDNITQLVLEYERDEGEFLAEDENLRTRHRYVEYMSREKFWMTRDGQWWNYITEEFVETKEEATIPNVLGIVPYVLITQNRIGSDFGVPCFYGRERQIDHLNALAARINYQIHKHVSGTWLIEGGGPPPTSIKMGDQLIWYVQKEINTTSQVSVHDLVSKLNIGEAINQQGKLLLELMNALPEMKATDGEYLSHQSGGTVAHLRLPAEKRIIEARTNIESMMIKAQQIGLSLGILHNMWNIGSGTGTREAADTAYAKGLLSHRFNKRPALPLTVGDELEKAKAKQAEAAAENPDTPKVKGGNNRGIISSTSGN
jgi:hypothetical protein